MALSLFAPATIRAQDTEDSLQLRVEIIPASPSLARVVLSGDSAVFIPDNDTSTVYVFDRRQRRFVIARHWHSSDPGHSGNASNREIVLPDSMLLTTVYLREYEVSYIVKDARGRVIPLRGPRVEVEKKWRTQHGLPPVPKVEEMGDVRYPPPTDWAPIRPLSYAIDDDAIWIGTAADAQYNEFTLGGLLRIDRRTHQLLVVDDSATLHSSITEIEPASNGYVLIAGGNVLRFDPKTMRSTNLNLRIDATDLRVENDTAFIAADGRISVADLRTGKPVGTGFRVAVVNDSISYAFADSTIEPSWDTRAILGVAEHLGIRRVQSWLEAATGIVKAESLEFFYPGDRITGREPVSYADSSSEEGDVDRDGPNAIYATGLDNPTLRPFLRDALLQGSEYPHVDIAKILLAEGDRDATPFLRAALKQSTTAYAAEFAKALALLGDSTGNLWIQSALLDTLGVISPLDTERGIHSFVFTAAAQVRDPRNVSRLLQLASHPRYSHAAMMTLLEYKNAALNEQLFAIVSRDTSGEVLSTFLGVAANDTSFEITPRLRDSIRNVSRRLLYDRNGTLPYRAARVLERYGTAEDLPYLIGALTGNESSYVASVIALVRLTGVGADAMPNGKGTVETRAAAQRWWKDWYAAHRIGLKVSYRPDSDPQVTAISAKIYSSH